MNTIRALALALAFVPLAANGALLVSEPPDLTDGLNSPDHLGSLTVGTNTISGSVSCFPSNGATNGCSGDAADAFSFDLPSGLVVSSFTITISQLVLEGAPTPQVRSFSDPFQQAFSSDGVIDWLALTGPLGAGTHDLQAQALIPSPCQINNSCDQLGLSYNWSVAIEVERATADAPEPATLALLGLGLAGFSWSRRRKVTAL